MLGAEGNYQPILLTCIDSSFPEPSIKYMQSSDMIAKYTQFTFAGASIGLGAPKFKSWASAFWNNLAASMQLHHMPSDRGAAKIAYGEAKVANKGH